MPISGLVITFNAGAADREQAIAALRVQPAIEIGEASDNKLAIVVETFSKRDDQEIWDWLHQLPAVSMVQVAFVGFEDDDVPDKPVGHDSHAKHQNGNLK